MKNSLFKCLFAGLCCAILFAGRAVADDITISVVAASAPNVYGSSNWSAWVANANYALEHGLTQYGTPGTPSYYQAAPATMSSSQNIVTGFPSWNGSADPGTTSGPAFANEYGNRLQFGLKVDGNGSKISIDQLSFSATTTNVTADNSLDFSYGIGSYGYSSDYMGIVWGSGGAGDYSTASYITGGAADQLVDEILSRGSGNAWAVYDDPSYAGATLQEKIDNFNATLGNDIAFTGTYSIGNVSGSDTVTFNPSSQSVPDSGATIALLGIGMIGMLGLRSGALKRFGPKPSGLTAT